MSEEMFLSWSSSSSFICDWKKRQQTSSFWRHLSLQLFPHLITFSQLTLLVVCLPDWLTDCLTGLPEDWEGRQWKRSQPRKHSFCWPIWQLQQQQQLTWPLLIETHTHLPTLNRMEKRRKAQQTSSESLISYNCSEACEGWCVSVYRLN